MNTRFYKIWLPVSLAVHLVLLFSCSIVHPFDVPAVGGDQYAAIEVVEAAVPKPEPPKPEVVPKPDKPLDIQTDHPTVAQPMPPAKTLTPGAQTIDPSIKTGTAKHAGSGKVDLTPGPGTKPTAAPDLMTSNNGGDVNAPKGTKDGMGDGGGTGAGPSGPSFGAKAKYGRNGSSKIAGEVNIDAAAVFTVQVNDQGNVVGVSGSTGNSDLDEIAKSMLRSLGYEATKKAGAIGKVFMRVQFSKGQYTIEEVKK